MLLKWALLPLLAAGGVAPVDEGTPIKLKPLVPLEPIAEVDFPATENFNFTFYGPIAQKVYSYYEDIRVIDLSRPYAPLSQREVTVQGGLTCVRRVAKNGPEIYRCNITFHPSQIDGLKQVIPPYAYELIPSFAAGKLGKVTLKLGDGRTLVQGACPRLGADTWAVSNYPCAYTTEGGDHPLWYFSEDINPQGIAVGWGIVDPGLE